MKFSLKKEWPFLLLLLMPFLYLAWIWPDLPDTVPTHFNARGEADGWGPKSSLFSILGMTVVLTYVILLLVPHIDPKGKIEKMGNKFSQLKFIMMLFMAAISIFIIYSAQSQEISSTVVIFVLVGGLIAALGNYFQALKHNYFIGIRTPWTLENETVWIKTHELGGKLWFVGGLSIVVLSFLLSSSYFHYVFMTIIGVLVLVPVFYSYQLFKKLKKD